MAWKNKELSNYSKINYYHHATGLTDNVKGVAKKKATFMTFILFLFQKETLLIDENSIEFHTK